MGEASERRKRARSYVDRYEPDTTYSGSTIERVRVSGVWCANVSLRTKHSWLIKLIKKHRFRYNSSVHH